MKQIIVTAMLIVMPAVFLSACSRSKHCCDECCERGKYRQLWDRHDCRHLHGDILMEREYYDARDFGPDCLYGHDRVWSRRGLNRAWDDCGYHRGGHNRKSYHHRQYRHGCYRCQDEDALSERALPVPAPEMEHDD